VQYLHELEALRDQLQQQVSRTSRLEGESRQLHKQLGELKADRQAAEAALQAERGELAGLRVAKEAAVSEKLRLQVSEEQGAVCYEHSVVRQGGRDQQDMHAGLKLCRVWCSLCVLTQQQRAGGGLHSAVRDKLRSWQLL
jgi:transcriptional accessory protein Tex/SPT6